MNTYDFTVTVFSGMHIAIPVDVVIDRIVVTYLWPTSDGHSQLWQAQHEPGSALQGHVERLPREAGGSESNERHLARLPEESE